MHIMAAISGGSAHFLDADHVARGIADGAVANPVRLIGRLLDDVGRGKMRWITVGPADQPGTSILLAPPAADPGITDDERRTIVEMMAKGTYGWILLATRDVDGVFALVQASGAEVVQEPTDQPYGVRDCAFRDPAGNLVRIQERR